MKRSTGSHDSVRRGPRGPRGPTARADMCLAERVLKELNLWPPALGDMQLACQCLEDADGNTWIATERMKKILHIK